MAAKVSSKKKPPAAKAKAKTTAKPKGGPGSGAKSKPAEKPARAQADAATGARPARKPGVEAEAKAAARQGQPDGGANAGLAKSKSKSRSTVNAKRVSSAEGAAASVRPRAAARGKGKGAVKPATVAPPAAKPGTSAKVRVLAVHRDVGALRLIREAVTERFHAEIDTSPLAERAFELALQRDYQLFFLDAELPEIRGELLYEMIEKAYRYAGTPRFAPAVAYVFDSVESDKDKDLRRDARVKGVLEQPLREERIIEVCMDVLPVKP